jgi:hypothetical protein
MGFHTINAVYETTHGADATYIPLTFHVKCAVTSWTAPSAPALAATTYSIYDALLLIDIDSLGYTQDPACGYTYTSSYTWTGLSTGITQNALNGGQLDVYSFFPGNEGTFAVTVTNDITLADNNGSINQVFTAAGGAVSFNVVIENPCLTTTISQISFSPAAPLTVTNGQTAYIEWYDTRPTTVDTTFSNPNPNLCGDMQYEIFADGSDTPLTNVYAADWAVISKPVPATPSLWRLTVDTTADLALIDTEGSVNRILAIKMTLNDWNTNTDYTYITVTIQSAFCDCTHLRWTAPSIGAYTVMVGTSQTQSVPFPAEDDSQKTVVPEFEQCYLNSGTCDTAGVYSNSAIVYDDGSVSGTALPAWITYSSSGTKAQPVTFDPTYAEIGTHTVKATYTPTYGTALTFTAYTITVQCQVTAWVLPTPPTTAAATYTVYGDMLSIDIHALGYTQTPNCNYAYTVAYTWTTGTSEFIRQDGINAGQINVSSKKPIPSAGVTQMELDAVISLADNNGSPQSFTLTSSVDFDVTIVNPCTTTTLS